jgi:hypothetical protein
LSIRIADGVTAHRGDTRASPDHTVRGQVLALS